MVLEAQENSMTKKLWIASPFFCSRGNYPLDMIVIHHIGSKEGKLYSLNGTITWFSDEEVHRNKKTGKIENKVSAHYIVPREPYKDHDIIHLVKDRDIAYHAGRSSWNVEGKKRSGINKYSIGIELEGDGNLVEYTDFQYDTLIKLVKELISIYDIPMKNIVGHEDISPERKVDPGEYFDWKGLMVGIDPPKLSLERVPNADSASIPPPEKSPPSEAPDEEFFMEDGRGKNFLALLLEFFLKIFK